MHIGGSSAAKGAVTAVRRRCASGLARLPVPAPGQLSRLKFGPAVGLAVLTPVVLAAAVGAAGPQPQHAVRDTAVTPLAAVASAPDDSSDGLSVVSAARPPTSFHFAVASTISAPPPPAIVVNSPGALGIPRIALNAYRNAERMMAAAAPGCGVSWNLLAGIGRIESMHANGGATDIKGTTVVPIYGPALDGTLPGNEIIVAATSSSGQVSYVRAMGPMQFLPGTWSRYASDGDGDGDADPQNLYDSTLAAARYLCSGGLNLRDSAQVTTSVLRYNNSVAYARNVLGWAAAYATGVAPLDLPPITGPVPAIGDSPSSAYTGLGPGLPMYATDPLAQMPVIEVMSPFGALPGLPGPATPPAPGCAVFCFGQQAIDPALPAAPLPAGPVAVSPVPAGPVFDDPAEAPAPLPVAEEAPQANAPDAAAVVPSAQPHTPQPQAPGPLPGPPA